MASPNIVSGQGPIPCEVMIIGEAPGKNEQEQGMPFIGRAGQVLNEALKFGGLARDEVYITNVYKTRPPNNRTPTWDEINSHLSILIDEFQSVQPKLTALLGATALKTFTGDSKISQKHGSMLFNLKETHLLDLPLDVGWSAFGKWFCTYHPAATFYNKVVRQEFFDDMKYFGDLVRTYTNE